MTNHWIDIKHSDVILIMGSNAAENHPISFKWVTEAQEKEIRELSERLQAEFLVELNQLIVSYQKKLLDNLTEDQRKTWTTQFGDRPDFLNKKIEELYLLILKI